ncbi:glycosyltransferase family 2 protein [Desulfobacula sp.]|uniref:glycosyltransferase family 2 protein n=1 Tax=Desulfobacula sp. TaxID=2593537 RepID=UPI001EB2CFE2|nr:glycosyltransferase family 2 protein [Desulfobacula sp.]
MKDAQPLVTVIVVTLNNLNLLRNCLRSLYTQDYAAMEIIVVDNGSDDDIAGMVSAEFPKVRMVRLGKNHGFAGGNNRGIEIARGKYVALINNDALASPQWLSSMVETAESDRRVGAVASIIIDGNSPDVLDSCGVGIGLDGMSRQAMRGMPAPELIQPKEVLLFSGCACLLRMEALKSVGLFDEDFFAYCEDTDLGLRIRKAGWKIVVAPKAYVEHYYSMTGGKFSLQKVYWVERNHFWVAIRNFPWVLLIFIPFFTIFRYFVQGYSILQGEGELDKFTKETGKQAIASAYFKAYVDMFVKLPAMLSKRRALQNKQSLGNFDMFCLIWKFRLPVDEIIGIKK